MLSKQNRLVKEARSLQRRKEREARGLCLIEGVRLLEESLQGPQGPSYCLYSQKLFSTERGRELLEQLEQGKIPCYEVEEALMDQLADTENPQGIVGVIPVQLTPWQEIVKEPNPLILLIDSVQYPGNLGTLLRTAEAAGATGVLLTKGTVDPFNPKTLRGTMGALFRQSVAQVEDLSEVLEAMKERGIRLVVGDLSADVDYTEGDFQRPLCVAVGNEGHGPCEEILFAADQLVKIPLVGPAESLNVAVAAGLLLYESVRQGSLKP